MERMSIIISAIVVLFLLLIFVIGPLLTEPRTELTPMAKEWQDAGEYIEWTSTLEENKIYGAQNVFTIQKGDPKNPAILMIHGYPTSSFDYLEIMELLSEDYYVCAIDTVGYGLSDKPKDGYIYSIEDDAKLVDYYVEDILKLESLTLLTHDKGDSVGLALLGLDQRDYTINHHIITNGNIYLPLADLTNLQKVLLSDSLGPFATKYINGDLFSNGLNKATHTIPESKEKVEAIASIIDHEDGGEVQHATIKYLNERKEYEEIWLGNLKNSSIPATLIWGTDDEIAPPDVADHAWSSYLKERKAPAEYWQLPKANHYLQNDNPYALSQLIRHSIGESVDFNDIPEEKRPVLIDINEGYQ